MGSSKFAAVFFIAMIVMFATSIEAENLQEELETCIEDAMVMGATLERAAEVCEGQVGKKGSP